MDGIALLFKVNRSVLACRLRWVCWTRFETMEYIFVLRGWDPLTQRTGIVQFTVDSRGVRRMLFRPVWIRRVRPYLSRASCTAPCASSD